MTPWLILLLSGVALAYAAETTYPSNGKDYGKYPLKCAEGYRSDDAGGCIDDDECRTGSRYVCGENAECYNTNGSYYCACRVGFKKNNKNKCEDEDECKTYKAICSKNEYCDNDYGGYECKCKKGYDRDYKTKTCVYYDRKPNYAYGRDEKQPSKDYDKKLYSQGYYGEADHNGYQPSPTPYPSYPQHPQPSPTPYPSYPQNPTGTNSQSPSKR